MVSLQTLIDEREIIRGLGRFARILDLKQWGNLGDVFAHDIAFDYGSGIDHHGIDALERQIRQYLDVCGPTQHLIGSILVDIAGEAADSRGYVQARHQRVGDVAGAIFDTTGEYRDRWERRAEGWRIVRRDAIWFLHSGDPQVLATEQAQLG